MMEHVMGRVKLASGWNTRGMCLHGTSTAVQLYPRHENIAEKGAGYRDGRTVHYTVRYLTVSSLHTCARDPHSPCNPYSPARVKLSH